MKLSKEREKTNPFRVPDNYFSTLTDRALAAIEEEERALAGHAASAGTAQEGHALAGHAASAGTAQEGHALAGRTIAAAAAEEGELLPAGETAFVRRTVRMKPFVAFAAALIGFALLATAIVRLATTDRHSYGYVPGVSLYADMMAEELDIGMLEYELSLYKPEEVSFEPASDEISPEAIIDYLVNEEIDLNDIYELL